KAVTPVEWSPCRPRTIQLPLTASPCGRLSRPRSTISQSDFHPAVLPFSPLRLGRSYKLVPEPDGSPLFTLLPLVACWRYEPREHLRPLALSRPAVPPSPLRDRVGYSDHVRFRGYFPVHFIPAYNLPVYASQWPLPDTTQDSVRCCSLDSSLRDVKQDDSNNEVAPSRGGEQIDDVLDGLVGAVVGGFESAVWAMLRVRTVVEAAVGKWSAQPFVEEQK